MKRLLIAAQIVGLGFVLAGAVGVYQYAMTPTVQLQHPDPHPVAAPRAGLGDALNSLTRPLAGAIAFAPLGGGPAPAAEATVTPVQRIGLWIEAPQLDIALPVIAGNTLGEIPFWRALVYPGTASPGAPGNSYIYAHGYWEMFGPLLYARVGDPIILHNYSTGTVETFHISRVVGRTNYRDVRWLHETSAGPMLTLQTCIDSSHSSDRFIVQAT